MKKTAMKKTPLPNHVWIFIGVLAAAVVLLSAALFGLGLEKRDVGKRADALKEELETAKDSVAAKEARIENLESEREKLEKDLETAKAEQEEAQKRAEEAEETLKEASAGNGTISPPQEETVFGGVANGYVVVLDAGHQGNGGDSAQEPVGPGAAQTKARDTGGTVGVGGYPEHELNLVMAQKLRDELTRRGYTVVMTRESSEVNLGNVDRASVANEADADVFLRIHANSSEDSGVYGALSMAVSNDNPYMERELIRQNQEFAQTLIDAFCEATAAYNRGVLVTDEMTGLNWSQVPSAIIEMGFMSNADEDARMQTADYQSKMAKGMADGIDRYLGVAGD